jgi:hypothetical protein
MLALHDQVCAALAVPAIDAGVAAGREAFKPHAERSLQ